MGRWFVPETATGLTVVIAPAMLVAQEFYERFAGWLAGQGVHVLTFDYRGAGQSLAAEQRRWAHRLEHWGERDLAAVIDHATQTRPGDRVVLLGHSMGGQIVGLTDRLYRLDGVVTIAATAAWWGHWPRVQGAGILGWYGLIPLLGRMVRTLPAGRLKLGPDTDMRLVRGWAKWGRHPDYLAADRFGLAQHGLDYGGPLLAYSFTDDELGCEAAVDALHANFTRARLTRERVDPQGLGVPAVGHFGFFQPRRGQGLWAPLLQWMRTA